MIIVYSISDSFGWIIWLLWTKSIVIFQASGSYFGDGSRIIMINSMDMMVFIKVIGTRVYLDAMMEMEEIIEEVVIKLVIE